MTLRLGSAVACAVGVSSAAAQPVAFISSDLEARAFGDEVLTDTFSATTDNLLQSGASYFRELSQFNPAIGETTSSTAEVDITRAHNFRPTTSPGIFLFDIDITGRVTRSAPVDSLEKPGSSADLRISLPTTFDPLSIPVIVAGSASYTSDQAGVGTALGGPSITALRLFQEATGPASPIAELNTADATFGTIDVGEVFGGDLVMEARSDISDQLTGDFGTSVVEFDFTITYQGVPAPSSAALLSLAGLAAARRRR